MAKESEKKQNPEADESTGDIIDGLTTLPRVGQIEVQTTMMRTEAVEEVTEAPKANIEWRLKPFVPKVKKQMVTMSDLGMTGGARGGVSASRHNRNKSES